MSRVIFTLLLFAAVCFAGIVTGVLLNIFIYSRLKGRAAETEPSYAKLVEAVNGLLYILVFAVNGFTAESCIYCLFTSALLALAVIDWMTYEIPAVINIFILVLGSIRLTVDFEHFPEYLAGFFSVSTVLLLLYIVTGGRAIGGGDVKLMAAAGFMLGWKLAVLAFFIGCISGSIVHIIRMKRAGADRILALGPYLAAGLLTSMLWGNNIIEWYLKTLQ